MAIAVIGGLITSTLLSLFYVPIVFTYVDDLKQWLARSRKLERCSGHYYIDRHDCRWRCADVGAPRLRCAAVPRGAQGRPAARVKPGCR
jgi:hypothetical protein